MTKRVIFEKNLFRWLREQIFVLKQPLFPVPCPLFTKADHDPPCERPPLESLSLESSRRLGGWPRSSLFGDRAYRLPFLNLLPIGECFGDNALVEIRAGFLELRAFAETHCPSLAISAGIHAVRVSASTLVLMGALPTDFVTVIRPGAWRPWCRSSTNRRRDRCFSPSR
jgi:hypothetical protein